MTGPLKKNFFCSFPKDPDLQAHFNIYKVVFEAVQAASPELDEDGRALIFNAIQRKSQPDLKHLLPDLITDASLADLLYQLPGLCGGIEVLCFSIFCRLIGWLSILQ